MKRAAAILALIAALFATAGNCNGSMHKQTPPTIIIHKP